MNPTSWIEINLTRLDANLGAFRRLVGSEPTADAAAASVGAVGGRSPSRSNGAAVLAEPATRVCGVIKADAYGLGALPIAQRLGLRGVDMLAVYSPAQAEQLAGLALPCPILVLMPTAELSRNHPLYRAASTGKLHLSVHETEQMVELDRAGRTLGVRVNVHLYADTGMSRGGLSLEELPAALRRAAELRHVRLAGVYTHPASADSDAGFTDEQVARLDAVLAEHAALLPPDAAVHVANTCAALRDRRFHRDMVRVGLGLFGYGVEQFNDGSDTAAMPPLQPVVRWLSRVVHVSRHSPGAPVGYNSTHRLVRESVLGVVPAGYADGYPLALSGRSSVDLPEWRLEDGSPLAVPVLGRVNMDQLVIDLTDAPPEAQACGALVELISGDPASPCALPRLAKMAGSSCYEMLCRLSPRVPRKHVVER